MELTENDFRARFGCTPNEFKGINEPYAFLGDAVASELLKKFGFCDMCLGSGTAWTECCDGTRCSCQGQAQPFTCRCCNGTGKHNESGEGNNTDYLFKVGSTTGGYLGTGLLD